MIAREAANVALPEEVVVAGLRWPLYCTIPATDRFSNVLTPLRQMFSQASQNMARIVLTLCSGDPSQLSESHYAVLHTLISLARFPQCRNPCDKSCGLACLCQDVNNPRPAVRRLQCYWKGDFVGYVRAHTLGGRSQQHSTELSR